MNIFKFYLNEDVNVGLAEALKRRGFDALTVRDAKYFGLTDEEQLKFASKQKRIIITCNRKHYIQLHKEFRRRKFFHCGIIISEQLPVGEFLRRVLNLCSSVSTEDMRNRLEYLSQWK